MYVRWGIYLASHNYSGQFSFIHVKQFRSAATESDRFGFLSDD